MQYAATGASFVTGWRTTKVSPDATHHLQEGEPLYTAKFDGVLAFHEPGFAPVRKGGAAWHISTRGEAVYSRRFMQAFGYYEGIAAVVSADGWHHILVDGSDLYAQRYAWCGNFQGERCTVRHIDGTYGHISPDGNPAYEIRWRYAGDFRDGIAVAQREDGLSTHIDPEGHLIHGCWFLDLDVFHKGFARARDLDGWTHIDREGTPVYARRFSMVEPFYNGQARVETREGALEVIDERGMTVVELRAPIRSVFHAVSADLVGFWRTDILGGAVELGVFDALPADTPGVARVCGVSEDIADRLMSALAEMDYVSIDEQQIWLCTARGDVLSSGYLSDLLCKSGSADTCNVIVDVRLKQPLHTQAGQPFRNQYMPIGDRQHFPEMHCLARAVGSFPETACNACREKSIMILLARIVGDSLPHRHQENQLIPANTDPTNAILLRRPD